VVLFYSSSQAMNPVDEKGIGQYPTWAGRERDRIGYQQFQILPYGDNFSDLAHFLNSLPHSRTLFLSSSWWRTAAHSLPHFEQPPSPYLTSSRPTARRPSDTPSTIGTSPQQLASKESSHWSFSTHRLASARENDAVAIQRILEESPTDPTYVLRSRTTAETPLHVHATQ
jgi:hypothetical protein